MQNLFSTMTTHLKEHRWQYFKYAGLAVLGVLGLIAATALAIGVLSLGVTFYAAIAIAIVLFFAVAWVPYALFLILVGFLRPQKKLITVRAKNSLVILCVASILGGIDLSAGSATPLELGTGMELAAVYAYAAVFVSLAFAVYLRLIYQEGVEWGLSRAVESELDRVSMTLTLPSSIIVNLLFDLIGPLLLVLVVIDLGGCGARTIVADGFDIFFASLARWTDGTFFEAIYRAAKGLDITPVTSAMSETWETVSRFFAQAIVKIPDQYLNWLDGHTGLLNTPSCIQP